MGIVSFGEVARLELSLTDNPGLERIQHRGESSADVAQGLRKARESCFTADRANGLKIALLFTPGILSGDIRAGQNTAIEVFLADQSILFDNWLSVDSICRSQGKSTISL